MYRNDRYGRYTRVHSCFEIHGPVVPGGSTEVTAVAMPPKWKRTNRLSSNLRIGPGDRMRTDPVSVRMNRAAKNSLPDSQLSDMPNQFTRQARPATAVMAADSTRSKRS